MSIGNCYIAKEQYSLALDKYMLCLEKVRANEITNKDALIKIIEKTISDLEKNLKLPTNGN